MTNTLGTKTKEEHAITHLFEKKVKEELTAIHNIVKNIRGLSILIIGGETAMILTLEKQTQEGTVIPNFVKKIREGSAIFLKFNRKPKKESTITHRFEREIIEMSAIILNIEGDNTKGKTLDIKIIHKTLCVSS
jgi:hypothetical protein